MSNLDTAKYNIHPRYATLDPESLTLAAELARHLPGHRLAGPSLWTADGGHAVVEVQTGHRDGTRYGVQLYAPDRTRTGIVRYRGLSTAAVAVLVGAMLAAQPSTGGDVAMFDGTGLGGRFALPYPGPGPYGDRYDLMGFLPGGGRITVHLPLDGCPDRAAILATERRETTAAGWMYGDWGVAGRAAVLDAVVAAVGG